MSGLCEIIVVGIMSAVTALQGYGDQVAPPCRYEDSTGCYWDAQARGNGLGHDVVSVRQVVGGPHVPVG